MEWTLNVVLKQVEQSISDWKIAVFDTKPHIVPGGYSVRHQCVNVYGGSKAQKHCTL